MIRKSKCCEICKKNFPVLHKHHIIPRCDDRCTNRNYNIAILCPNCHAQVHTGEFIIIGFYESTSGGTLVWFKKGEQPPLEEDLWLVKNNVLVTTLKGDQDDLETEKENGES